MQSHLAFIANLELFLNNFVQSFGSSSCYMADLGLSSTSVDSTEALFVVWR